MTARCQHCQDRPRRPRGVRCGPCTSWYYYHDHTERPLGLPYQPRLPRDRPCVNCALRPHAHGSVRCAPCTHWYYRHGQTERPRRLWLRPAPRRPGGPCLVCGAEGGRRTQGRCRRDYAYWWRHGQDRPLALRPPPGSVPCQDCGVPPTELHYGPRTQRTLTRGLCPACYMRWWRAGRKQRAGRAA